MAAQSKITISTEFLATVKGMDDVVRQMQQGLSKADPVKASGFNKMVSNMAAEYKNFLNLTKNGQVDLLDAKAVEKSSKKIIDLFRQITDKYGEISSMSTADLKKFFPDAFNKNVSEATALIDNFVNTSKRMRDIKDERSGLEGQITRLGNVAKDAEAKIKSLLGDKYADADALRAAVDKSDKALAEAKQTADNTKAAIKDAFVGIRTDAASASIKELTDAGKKGATAWANYKAASDQAAAALKNVGATEQTDIETLKKKKEALEAVRDEVKKSGANSTNKAKAVASDKRAVTLDGSNITTVKELDAYLAKLDTTIAAVTKETETLNTAQASGFTQEQAEKIAPLVGAYTDQARAAKDAAAENKKLKATLNEVETSEKEAGAATQQANAAQVELNNLKREFDGLQGSEISIDQLLQKLKDLGIIAKDATLETAGGIDGIRKALSNMDEESAKKLVEYLKEMGSTAEETGDLIDDGLNGRRAFEQAAQDVKRLNSEVENMKNRVKTFFGLNNAIRLFQRAIRSAISTVKELDATMVETAVVTDFNVGDMWDQLPEYTKRAKELGVSINDTYKAATLYYQQGTEENLTFSKICSII